MDRFVVTPEKVRGLGNVLEDGKTVKYSTQYTEYSVIGKEIVDGNTVEVNGLSYVNSSLYFTLYPSRTVTGYLCTVKGMALDDREPLVGVEVSLLKDGTVVDTSISSETGEVVFEVLFGVTGVSTLQLSYQGVKSGGVAVNVVPVNRLVTNDIWVTAGRSQDFTVTVFDGTDSVSDVPVTAVIGEDTITQLTDENGASVFTCVGDGVDDTINISCGELTGSVNVHDGILILHDGDTMSGKNYALNRGEPGPGTKVAYMDWGANGFTITPSRNAANTAYENSRFVYRMILGEWIDDTTFEVIDDDVGFTEASVEFTYRGGSGNLPLNFYAWKNSDGTDPYFVLRYRKDTGKYWVSCKENGEIVQYQNIAGSLGAGDKFKLIFENGSVTVQKNGSVLTQKTFDNEELRYGFLAPLDGSGTYNDFKINVPTTVVPVDSVTLSADKSVMVKNTNLILSATVLDENEDPIQGKSVTFKQSGTVIGTAVSGSDGVAVFEHTPTVAGTFNYTAVSGGVDSNSVSVRIKNAGTVSNVVLSASPNPAVVNQSITVLCTVTDGDGDPVAGRDVYIGGAKVGVTDSDGLFSKLLSFSTAGSYQVSMTVDNVSGSVTVSVVDVPVPDSVSLTGDKSILSYADSDSCVLTATVLDSNNNPCVGETVSFDIVGGSNIDSATTGADGTCSVYYYSEGTGDLNIQASCRSLLSETYSIQDCYYYDSQTVDKQRYSITSGSASLTYSSNGLNVKGTTSSNTIVENNMLSLPTNYVAEVTIGGKNGSGADSLYFGGFVFDNILLDFGNTYSYVYSYSPITKIGDLGAVINMGDKIRLEKDNGSMRIYLNDVLKTTQSTTTTGKFLHRTYNNRSLTIKDLKVKPL